jgi:hypothetical protein
MRRATRLVGTACLLISTSCDQEIDVAAPQTDAPLYSLSRPPQPNTSDDRLARAVAATLSHRDARREIFEGMRTSRYRRAELPITSTLRAYWSRWQKYAAEFDVLQQNSNRPTYEVVLPSPQHRLNWKGDDDIIVVAASAGLAELFGRPTAVGYTLTGERVVVPLYGPTNRAVLVVVPWVPPHLSYITRTPPDASVTRVSSVEQEFATMTAECDDWAKHCDNDGGIGNGPGIAVGSDCGIGAYDVVTPADDLDRDGIKDICEWRVAYLFEPQLVFDVWEAYSLREPTFIVQKGDYDFSNTLLVCCTDPLCLVTRCIAVRNVICRVLKSTR